MVLLNTFLLQLISALQYYMILCLIAFTYVVWVSALTDIRTNPITGQLPLNPRVYCKYFQNFLYLQIILQKVSYVRSGFIMFGHLSITPIVVAISILFLILGYMCIYVLATRTESTRSTFYIYALCVQFLIVLARLLWTVTTFIGTLLILDCMNIVILALLLTVHYENAGTGFTAAMQRQVVALTTYFWTSFLVTILLLVGGFFILLGTFSLNFVTSYMVLILLITNGTLSIHTAICGVLLILLGLFIKLGLCIFVVWKRVFFSALTPAALLLYTTLYYSNLFIYAVVMLIQVVTILPMNGYILFIAILLLTFVTLRSLFGDSQDITTFFVNSTLLNTTIILLVILGCCI